MCGPANPQTQIKHKTPNPRKWFFWVTPVKKEGNVEKRGKFGLANPKKGESLGSDPKKVEKRGKFGPKLNPNFGLV